MENNNAPQPEKRKFRLYEHPWLAMLAFILSGLFSIILSSNVVFLWFHLSGNSWVGSFVHEITFKILSSFILAPLVLRLPIRKKNIPAVPG